MMDVKDSNLVALLDAAVLDPKVDAEEAMPNVADNLDAFCNSKVVLVALLPDKRPGVITKKSRNLTAVFAA